MSEELQPASAPPRILPPALGRWRRAWSGAMLVARESLRTFQRNHALETAATLSWYAMLSVLPLLLLSFFFLSRAALTSRDAMAAVEAVFARLSPELGGAVMRETRALSEQRLWTGISLFALFWIVTPFAATWRAAFGRAFAAETRRRSFLRAKLRDLLGALTLWALFLMVVLGKIAEDALQSRVSPEFSPLLGISGFLFSFGFVFLALLLFYAVLEPVRPRFGPLAAGALTAASLLFVLRPAFNAFLRFNPDYGFAFGSLKAAFVLLMWGYGCFVVLLFGAEVTSNARRRDAVLLRGALDPAATRGAVSPLVREFLRTWEPGALLFREGDPGHSMYVVRNGEVRLTRGGGLIHVARPGGYFGEMTLLTDAPRSATAEAGPDGAELVEIARKNFDLIVRENPHIVEAMLREFAWRLRPNPGKTPSKTGESPEEENTTPRPRQHAQRNGHETPLS